MGEVRATWKPCDLCEDAWRGLIEAKIALEERLRQMTHNHDHTLRMYARERSRADKAEMELRLSSEGEKS